MIVKSGLTSLTVSLKQTLLKSRIDTGFDRSALKMFSLRKPDASFCDTWFCLHEVFRLCNFFQSSLPRPLLPPPLRFLLSSTDSQTLPPANGYLKRVPVLKYRTKYGSKVSCQIFFLFARPGCRRFYFVNGCILYQRKVWR